jgi:hypothetical protein
MVRNGDVAPSGLAPYASGMIFGIPTMSGLVEFTITATDANVCVSTACTVILCVASPGGQ